MAEFGVFTPEQARDVLKAVQEMRQATALINRIQRQLPDLVGFHRVFVKNESGETVPPFGCMEVFGTAAVEDKTTLRIRKPSDACGEFVFNSEYEIEAGGYGWAYAWGLVRMRGTFSSYEACKRYRPDPNAWTVSEGPGPFLVYGTDNSYTGALRGRIVGESCKAKWIKFYYDPADPPDAENVPIDAFYDGPDPSDCGDVSVAYPLGEPCAPGDVLAFYDPNTDTYQATATPAAMLGEAEEQTFLAAISPLEGYGGYGEDPEEEACGFNYVQTTAKVFCTSSGGAGEVRFNVTNQEVITNVELGADGLILKKSEIAVCTSVEIDDGLIPLDEQQVVRQAYFVNGCKLHLDYDVFQSFPVIRSSVFQTPIKTVDASVVSSIYLTNDGLTVDVGIAKVCAFEDAGSYVIPATDCVDEYYYPPEECGPCDITAQEGQSVWQVVDGEWVLYDYSMIPEGATPTPPTYPPPANCECGFGSYVCGDPGGIPAPEENEALWQFRGGEWHLIIDCVSGTSVMPTVDGEECEYRITQCNGCCENTDPLIALSSIYVTVKAGNPDVYNVFSVLVSLGPTSLAYSPKQRTGTAVINTPDGIYGITVRVTINCEGVWTVSVSEANLSTGQSTDAFLMGTTTVDAECVVENISYDDDDWNIASGV